MRFGRSIKAVLNTFHKGRLTTTRVSARNRGGRGRSIRFRVVLVSYLGDVAGTSNTRITNNTRIDIRCEVLICANVNVCLEGVGFLSSQVGVPEVYEY
jgi:hypothetical protein